MMEKISHKYEFGPDIEYSSEYIATWLLKISCKQQIASKKITYQYFILPLKMNLGKLSFKPS